MHLEIMPNNARAVATQDFLQVDQSDAAEDQSACQPPAVRSSREAAAVKTKRAKPACRSVPTAIIDKSALYRAGLIHILADTRFGVVADCSRLDELPAKVLNGGAALLVVGLDKDADAALTQMPRLAETHRDLRVVVLSERFDPEQALIAIRAGGSSYLVRDEVSPDILVKSLELALLGVMVISHEFLDGIANSRVPLADGPVRADCEASPEQRAAPPSVEAPQRAARLSGRERIILSHLMRGASNKHIARELGIAEATVKVHVKSLLRKVRVRNRTQAAMWGINNPELRTTRQMDEQPDP